MAGTKALAKTAATCPTLNFEGLQTLVKERGPLEVVFFASWCGDCRRHLKESAAKGTILIATYDEKERAEKAYAAFGAKAPCYLDDGVAEALGVKGVPTVMVLSGDELGKRQKPKGS